MGPELQVMPTHVAGKLLVLQQYPELVHLAARKARGTFHSHRVARRGVDSGRMEAARRRGRRLARVTAPATPMLDLIVAEIAAEVMADGRRCRFRRRWCGRVRARALRIRAGRAIRVPAIRLRAIPLPATRLRATQLRTIRLHHIRLRAVGIRPAVGAAIRPAVEGTLPVIAGSSSFRFASPLIIPSLRGPIPSSTSGSGRFLGRAHRRTDLPPRNFT